jgi:hypothetical protein
MWRAIDRNAERERLAPLRHAVGKIGGPFKRSSRWISGRKGALRGGRGRRASADADCSTRSESVTALPVGPHRDGVPVSTLQQHLRLFALFAELLGGIDREQHRFSLGLVRPVFFAGEFNEPEISSPANLMNQRSIAGVRTTWSRLSGGSFVRYARARGGWTHPRRRAIVAILF